MRALICGALMGLVACAAPNDLQEPSLDDFQPDYLDIQTRLLDGDLVNFIVEMRGARTKTDVADFAECAAAQYTLIRGFGFARHIRTNVNEEAGIWRGDAVYTVSPTLPRGTRAIDAEVKLAACKEQGIPTV